MCEFLGQSIIEELQFSTLVFQFAILQNNFVTKDIDPVNFYFTSTIGDLIADYVSGKIPGSVKKENIELRKSTII